MSKLFPSCIHHTWGQEGIYARGILTGTLLFKRLGSVRLYFGRNSFKFIRSGSKDFYIASKKCLNLFQIIGVLLNFYS